ncbi:MAG: AgmX/PglI C-terminal domain-containing protein [Polyangiaceae bacterium]
MSFRVALVLAGSSLACAALTGCGAATPAAQAPTEIAVVSLDPAKPKPEGDKNKAANPATDAKAAQQQSLKEAEEFGMIGLLSTDGVPFDFDDDSVGGVIGTLSGVATGTAFGSGGLGLSGVGVGGGGTGGGTIGLGSIGTIGKGSGGGSGFGSGRIGVGGGGYGEGIRGYQTNPVAGQSIYVSGSTVVELGDAVALGLSVEQGARVMRDRVYSLRSCYSRGLEKNSQLAGMVALRLVVGADGHVKVVRDLGSSLPDRTVIDCIIEGLDEAYVGYPSSGLFGVIETTVSFSKKAP